MSTVKSQEKIDQLTSEDVLKSEGYNPLTPATAAFYSAILPGLGQVYNKQYWKLPFVYGAMATSMYYFSINNESYKRYRRIDNGLYKDGSRYVRVARSKN